MKRLFLIVALATASCQSARIADRAEPGDSSIPAVDAGWPETLVGQYRVAAIDGSEVGGGISIALAITDTLIAFAPRCAGFGWTYSYDDGVLATDRPQKPRNPDAPFEARPAAPVCRIAVHPEQERLARALDAVTQARRIPANGIELIGGGHSVTLYSQ